MDADDVAHTGHLLQRGEVLWPFLQLLWGLQLLAMVSILLYSIISFEGNEQVSLCSVVVTSNELAQCGAE